MKDSVRETFATREGLRSLCRGFVTVFGGFAAVASILFALWPQEVQEWRWWVLGLATVVSFGGAILVARPRNVVVHTFRRPDIKIAVKVGDLFAQEGDVVVGFADTFDTDTTGDKIIAANSIQGQFEQRVYRNDFSRLDAEITESLKSVAVESQETQDAKQYGKLDRYPLGTVAVIGAPDKKYFCLAYSRLGNDLKASSTLNDLWLSIGSLWEAIDSAGRRHPVAMAVIGTDRARINCLDHENFVKMLALSFFARSEQRVFTHELTIVVHSGDRRKVNFLSVAAFLRSLGS